MDYKILFFDMDGTLATLDTHEVPQSTIDALHQAKQNGVKLFLATGRHRLYIKDDSPVLQLPLDGFLTCNGQYCFTAKDGPIYKMPIPYEDRAGLAAYLRQHPQAFMFLAEDELYTNISNEQTRQFYEFLGDFEIPVKDPATCLEHDIYAMILFGGKEAEHGPLSVMPDSVAVRWHPTFADIIPAKGGKHVGIDAVLAHYGFTRQEAMAFGDAHNDITMLQHVGMGVAMGNALDDVKKIAGFVTKDITDDGIQYALKHFGII